MAHCPITTGGSDTHRLPHDTSPQSDIETPIYPSPVV